MDINIYNQTVQLNKRKCKKNVKEGIIKTKKKFSKLMRNGKSPEQQSPFTDLQNP